MVNVKIKKPIDYEPLGAAIAAIMVGEQILEELRKECPEEYAKMEQELAEEKKKEIRKTRMTSSHQLKQGVSHDE